VHVRTDLLDVELDTLGADLVRLDLLDYPVDKGGAESVRLLDAARTARRVVQSGLRASTEGAAPDHRALWRASSDHFVLAEGQTALAVAFSWDDYMDLVREDAARELAQDAELDDDAIVTAVVMAVLETA